MTQDFSAQDIPDSVFSGQSHRMSMGLRPLDMSTWLDARPGHPQIAEKARLLASHRSEVFAQTPDGGAAAATAAGAVSAWVGRPLPGRDHPLVEAASMVRDDLCVLAPVDDQWRMVSAVVCFPSRWRLSDKIGRDVLAIHDPVPRYRQELGAATTKVFASLRGPRWRVNWTILDDPVLFQPKAQGPVTEKSYLRVERQCLVPVEQTIVFSIRTTVVPVAQLPKDKADALFQSVRATPEDLAAYRGWPAQ